MSIRADAEKWIVEALRHFGGSATIVQINKYIWEKYEGHLRSSGDAFYTWQYDVRWAGQALRDKEILKSVSETKKGVWELKQLN